MKGTSVDFSKIKVGVKNLDDAIIDLGTYKKLDPRLGDKKEVMRAIREADYHTLKEISNFFIRVSGIYARLVRYLAYLYRYDWWVVPYVNDEKMPNDKVLKGFHQTLKFLDNSEIKQMCGDIAYKVIRDGCFYGYKVPVGDRIMLQELPPEYCRTRFFAAGNKHVVEFNMRFFDVYFRDAAQRMKMLKLFPPEFKKGYQLYKEGKLVPDFPGDTNCWYMLDPNQTIKFNINNSDQPFLISVIPAIIDLDRAQDLDRKKMAQKLLKIIIQKLPLDKNGDLLFDPDEARELHNNAVAMLQKAIGVDVLTTFADVDVADMADRNTTTSVDDLEKVERAVFNEGGISQMQFNTDGNIALEKSIANDEAAIYNLLVQFESFINEAIAPFNKTPKRLEYKFQMLTTTIYNYKEMSKLYKEQTQLGYSKFLPQIALGQSQSAILAAAYFENDVLDLTNVFIPPMQSSVMNAEALQVAKDRGGKNDGAKTPSDDKGGRPEKEDGEKSEKTIQNKESMS